MCVRRKGASTIYKKPFDVGKESIVKDIHNYILFLGGNIMAQVILLLAQKNHRIINNENDTFISSSDIWIGTSYSLAIILKYVLVVIMIFLNTEQYK